MKEKLLLRPFGESDIRAAQLHSIDEETLRKTATIICTIRERGEAGVRHYAEYFSELTKDDPLLLPAESLTRAREALLKAERDALETMADRISRFAVAQRETLTSLSFPIPEGTAGHDVIPLDQVGCYAPGGRYPLPSSVLMTAISARAAGVASVWVASPNPSRETLAAAAIAKVDGFLPLGGVQAICALAFGIGLPRGCDMIVGPGNRWVTAAKRLLAGEVGIDMLAGPSELLIVADESADPSLVAADLLAQAEHDPDARPMLISTSQDLIEKTNEELRSQLQTLPTRPIAEEAFRNGFSCLVPNIASAAQISNSLAPEHLQLMFKQAREERGLFRQYGALFLGERSAEIFGDYGAGPNHVLPTGGTARFTSGLSVLTFLRVRTWLDLRRESDLNGLRSNTVALARMEGLEGHARAAERRA